MTQSLNEKYQHLISFLQGLKKVAIAFSGGVDSTFLVYACKEALGDQAIAFTVNTPYIPGWEIEEARELVLKLNIKHQIIEAEIPDNIKHNPSDRCYLCKTQIFTMLKSEAKKRNINFLLEGTNKDDEGDYRPGMKALDELNVVSPLREVRLNKEEIRQLSKKFNLPTWDKPSNACLLTRFPYDTNITQDALTRVEEGERHLSGLGFRGARLRSHGTLARIELQAEQFSMLEEESIKNHVVERLKSVGYEFVCIDLEGYKMGSYDPVN